MLFKNQEAGPPGQCSVLLCCFEQFYSLPNLHTSLNQAKTLEQTASIQPRRSLSGPFQVRQEEVTRIPPSATYLPPPQTESHLLIVYVTVN